MSSIGRPPGRQNTSPAFHSRLSLPWSARPVPSIAYASTTVARASILSASPARTRAYAASTSGEVAGKGSPSAAL
jgi:hypothetical protein